MQVGIRHNFVLAVAAWKRFSKSQRQLVRKLADDLYAIKKETEQTAIAFGYSSACRTSIAVCRGECCRLHFPKTFTEADFLTIISSLTSKEREFLSERILSNRFPDGQCILLLPDGCLLPFKSRPMVCTNAYPCFSCQAYWKVKEAGNRRAKPLFQSLNGLILQKINNDSDISDNWF